MNDLEIGFSLDLIIGDIGEIIYRKILEKNSKEAKLWIAFKDWKYNG